VKQSTFLNSTSSCTDSSSVCNMQMLLQKPDELFDTFYYKCPISNNTEWTPNPTTANCEYNQCNAWQSQSQSPHDFVQNIKCFANSTNDCCNGHGTWNFKKQSGGQCTCEPNMYTGSQCQTPIPPADCSTKDCGVGGTCTLDSTNPTKWSCVCKEGYDKLDPTNLQSPCSVEDFGTCDCHYVVETFVSCPGAGFGSGTCQMDNHAGKPPIGGCKGPSQCRCTGHCPFIGVTGCTGTCVLPVNPKQPQHPDISGLMDDSTVTHTCFPMKLDGNCG